MSTPDATELPPAPVPAEPDADLGREWLRALDILRERAFALLDPEASTVPSLQPDDVPSSLLALQDDLPLDDIDLAIIIIAAASVLDTSFETTFQTLNHEPDAVGPTVATVMLLAGLDPLDGQDRARFADTSILRVLSIIESGPASRGLLRQVVRVPEQVVRFLLGHWEPDPEIIRALRVSTRDPLPVEALPELPLPEGFPIVIRARAGTAAIDHVRSFCLAATGLEPMVFDASQYAGGHGSHDALLKLCARDASLVGTLLVVDYRTSDSDTPLIEALSLFEFIGVPFVAIVDMRRALGTWERSAAVAPLPTLAQREEWWRLLAPHADASLARTATHLEPEDIITRGDPALARTVVSSSSRTRRSRVQTIDPEISLADVVASDRIHAQLTALADRVRYRTIVLDEWRMRPGGGRGRGVTALFAGASGTGKSMSAEALAGDLGVPLFKVDLASVVDKYIGETEKNLEEVFRSVENDDGVLLFDEADALFGKRSDVSDARDRYANIEVAYLLQRIEQFDGLAILTTNLRANLDEAFQRRLDSIISFDEPDELARYTIWAKALGPFEGTVSEGDLRALSTIDVTGGSIRSSVVTAAYVAAAAGQSLRREHLLRGLQEEWRKSGRLNFPVETFSSW